MRSAAAPARREVDPAPRDARGIEALPVLLTVQDIARRFHVGQSTIYEWHRLGRLPAYRLGDGTGALRFSLEDVLAFLEAQREP